jgi:hypothetical protein
MLKVFLASRLKKLLTGRVLLIIHRISAVALAGFGIILIIRAVFNL